MTTLTPSAQAKKIVQQFANHSRGDTVEANLNSAKNCAHIDVDRIIYILDNYRGSTQCAIDLTYWKAVKVEIDNIKPS